jgi:hypothetical protein
MSLLGIGSLGRVSEQLEVSHPRLAIQLNTRCFNPRATAIKQGTEYQRINSWRLAGILHNVLRAHGVVEQYKAQSPQWAKLKPASREIYNRRFDDLQPKYGSADCRATIKVRRQRQSG